MKFKRQVLAKNNEEIILPVSSIMPISIYESYFSDTTYDCVNWHWHQGFQLCLVLSGQIRFRIPNQEYCLEEGQAVWINYKQPHFIEKISNEPASYICFDFPYNLLDGLSDLQTKYLEALIQNDKLNLYIFNDLNNEVIKIWRKPIGLPMGCKPPFYLDLYI